MQTYSVCLLLTRGGILQSFFMQSAAVTAACGECVIKQLSGGGSGLFKTTLSSLDSEATTLTFFLSPVKRVVPILGTRYLIFWHRSRWESGVMPVLRGVAPAALGLLGEHRLATLVFQPVGKEGKNQSH